MDPDLLTKALDIGLGAVALLLWVRQGKINKAQVELDIKQGKSTQDLTIMVKDHEVRIGVLEASRPGRRRQR